MSVELLPKTPLKDLTAELQFDMPDLDHNAMPHYLRRSAIRMAQVGKLMWRTVEIRTYRCVDNYLVEPPDCVDIVSVLRVKNICGGCCGEVIRKLSDMPQCFRCGTRSWFKSPNMIFFSPALSNNVFEVTVAVAPKSDACEIDTELATKYFDTLILGAKSYLYDLSDKPWSNRTKAQELKERFEKSLRAAAADKFMEGQSGVLHGPGRRIM